jgi:hypothetical protein
MDSEELPNTEKLAALVAARTEEAGPQARLRVEIELGRELSDSGDALIERFVAAARAAGVSWTEIGALFGTSKQAAQKRYAAAVSEPGGWPGHWTPPAQDVLARAGEQARDLGHNYVGTEHVVLGLLDVRDGLAAHVLTELGITSNVVLGELARMTGPCQPHPYDWRGAMPRLKQALEHARRIAAGLGHQAANTEHLLAGIVSVPDALAVKILSRHGVSADDARAALAQRLQIEPAQLVVARPRRRRRLLAKTR